MGLGTKGLETKDRKLGVRDERWETGGKRQQTRNEDQWKRGKEIVEEGILVKERKSVRERE